MGIDFGIIRRAARHERARTFNPEVPPPHGDFPYLDVSRLHVDHEDANHAWVKIVLAFIAAGIIVLAVLFVFAMISLYPLRQAPHRFVENSQVILVRDDGRYANEPLHAWFDQLASGKGLCCSFADGVKVEDVDWDTQDACEHGKTGGAGNATVAICGQHYRVRLHGEWIVVPDGALVTEPNRFGLAVVWPYMDSEGATQIRCFIPGAGA